MEQKTEIDRLRTWNHAKQCLIDAIPDGDIYTSEWPERLGLQALAVLQSMGEPIETRTLMTLLLKSDTPRQARQHTCPQIIDSIYDETISPDDFRNFLNSYGVKPSTHVQAWFEALDVGVKDSSSNNDLEISSQLNAPKRKDAWFDAIYDMACQYCIEYEELPNTTQAWSQLWNCPPNGYNITTGTDKGEDCLMMSSEKPLGKNAFEKRWRNYTTNKAR